MKTLLAAMLSAAPLLAAAQSAAPRPDAAAMAVPPEPQVQRIVIEDEGARIEELRVRGQTLRIVVTPRHGAPYEIVPAVRGRDPSQNRAGGQPGAGGQRVWNLFQF
ncbi:MAG TPA: DUF2782 domain-containing protein [Burkholderiaceae bacterium]|nr:DUF2782 domain-containing protein [Burkholderiaceae bacterium]